VKRKTQAIENEDVFFQTLLLCLEPTAIVCISYWQCLLLEGVALNIYVDISKNSTSEATFVRPSSLHALMSKPVVSM
jgi:hypothetical protein